MKLNIPKTISTIAIAAMAFSAPAFANCSGDTCLDNGGSDQTTNPAYMGGFTDVQTRLSGGQGLLAGTDAGGEGQNVFALTETKKDGKFGLESDIYVARECDTPVCGSAGASLRGHARDVAETWGYSGAESAGSGPQFATSGVENYAIGEQVLGGRVAVTFGQFNDDQ